MKYCDPLVLGPLLAMERRKGSLCFNLKFSSVWRRNDSNELKRSGWMLHLMSGSIAYESLPLNRPPYTDSPPLPSPIIVIIVNIINVVNIQTVSIYIYNAIYYIYHIYMYNGHIYMYNYILL